MEILINHAGSIEPCNIQEIKNYRPSTNSLCERQVLACPYENKKARIIVREMAERLAYQFCDRGMVTDSLTMILVMTGRIATTSPIMALSISTTAVGKSPKARTVPYD